MKIICFQIPIFFTANFAIYSTLLLRLPYFFLNCILKMAFVYIIFANASGCCRSRVSVDPHQQLQLCQK